jgi:hypothetical protein
MQTIRLNPTLPTHSKNYQLIILTFQRGVYVNESVRSSVPRTMRMSESERRTHAPSILLWGVALQLPKLEAATIEPVNTESIILDAGLLDLTIYTLCLKK